jgi:CheY-like chemotaxis protein
MPRGGKLVIQTANRRLDQEAANRTTEGRPGDYAHLQVRDTGAGMMPEVRERIFEPFFTTKEPGKGTGLGLAMVFGIVKAHGGWIECQSEPARGTTFDIYFPAITSASPAAANAASADGIRGGQETILLADDEQVVGRLGETILKRHGYQVLVAANGAEALRIFRERHQEIDLVILDLSMPELSGAETLRELRKINPSAHVLISSGHSTDEDVRSVEREGVLGFVGKPYRPAELARQVRAVLDKIQGQKVQGAPDGRS